MPLLKAGILLVDNIQLALPPHDLAIGTTLFNGCTHFHTILLFIPEYDPSPCQIVWTHFHPNLIPRQYPNIIHPHFPRNGGQYFMTIFQLYLEHRVGQGFQNDAILFNECLFRHTEFGSAKIGIICIVSKNRNKYDFLAHFHLFLSYLALAFGHTPPAPHRRTGQRTVGTEI